MCGSPYWSTSISQYRPLARDELMSKSSLITFVSFTQDVPHVAYQNLSGNVKTISYATLNVSATQITGYNVWIIETVDTNLGDTAGSWLSIDLDSQDRPHISYYSGDGVNSIKYAFKNSTGWHNHTVDSGLNKLGWFSAIKIDSTDNPQIAYSRIDGNTLKYAIYDGSNWHTENVGAQVGGDKKGLQLALSNLIYISSRV